MRDSIRARRAFHRLDLNSNPHVTGIWLIPPGERWTIRVGLLADTPDARHGIPTEVDGVPVDIAITGSPIVGILPPDGA